MQLEKVLLYKPKCRTRWINIDNIRCVTRYWSMGSAVACIETYEGEEIQVIDHLHRFPTKFADDLGRY